MIGAVVRRAAELFGSLPAIVAPAGWSISYRELHTSSDEVAAGFSRAGIGPGDVVALLLPSSVDYVVAYLALAKLGAVTAGVNPRLAAPEHEAALAVAAPELVLTLDDVEPATSAATVLHAHRVAGASAPTLATDPARPVAIVFTSGTTGTPKGAVFTNRQLAAVSSTDAGTAWGGGGPMLASTQLVHVGFMTKLPWYLRLGSTIHLVERWRAEEALRLISRHRLPSIGGVAPQIALLLRVPGFERHDLRAVRTIVAGGAPSPPALVREARARFGAAYSIRYSSTESGGIGTGTAFDADDEEALHTVGRPRSGVEVRVDDGGEVWLQSDAVMERYWRDPVATDHAIVDGWLRTGDLGTLDDRGCLRLAGRSSDLYIRGGYNVHPMEVEAVLSSHPAVAAVAVVARPDDVMGEVGVAAVVATDPGSAPSLGELREWCRTRLAGYKAPDALVILESLPRTAMDKIDRRALALAALAEHHASKAR